MNVESGISRKVQMLRAFAIIAVVFIHTCPDGMWQVAARPFINFGVGLFLFLSGWLTKADCSDWGRISRKRVMRVMIPYVIWTVLYSLQKGAPDKIVFNLLTTKASSALYYIFVYVQFVLLTPLLVRLARSRFRWAGLLVAPVSVLLCVYLPMIAGFDLGAVGDLVWNVCCLGWFSFYYLGLLLGNGYAVLPAKKPVSRPGLLILLLAISLVLQMLEGWLWYESGWPNCGSQLKLTSLLTTSAVLLLADAWLKSGSSPHGSLGSFPVRIGDLSFGVYFVHIPVLRFLQSSSWYAALPFGLNTALVLAVTLVAVSLLSRLFGPRISRLLGLQ